MNQFTTEIVQALDQKQDITEVFRSHLETALNSLLAVELTEFLDYEKYDRIGFNSGNSRNGEFKQHTVAPYKRTNDTLEATVIHLFKKGITMAEISSLIEKHNKRFQT